MLTAKDGLDVGTVRILIPKQAGICLVYAPKYQLDCGGYVEIREHGKSFVGKVLTVTTLYESDCEQKLADLIAAYGREPLEAVASFKPNWKTKEVEPCEFCPA